MKQAIIFDMDGTLFQTNMILEPALAATFDALRENELWFGETPISKYREIMGVPLPVVWETLCPNHSEEVREKSNELFQKKLIEMITLCKGALYPNVAETLQSLSIQYPLFVASNGEWEYLQAIIDTYELNQLFEKIYSIQSIASGNKSELVKSVIEENELSSAWVVGDRLSDIMAAKENGLVSIGVNFDFAQQEELNQADFVINEMKELLTVIR
ncbi:HAD hydrolase-like protein [Ureibacillus chungkukjangi]|uniref:Adenosylhomocysteine nucleosidase n=1 Tax=Ureibacillus chungkukjangi TaxID=1202712 RepID=A0A318TUF0_9BACL|nr:HAD hydrolase-like protein [Ureibacillus chungkukjangi]PYF08274.1 adenosylhomocysteine nucleosidase [Ureibacillus chungkukjangi]